MLDYRFGAVSNFILPPSKTVALIEFIEPVEARQAFKSLAYKKYKHVPLYLEWAPLDIIMKTHQHTCKNNTTTTMTTTVAHKAEQIVENHSHNVEEVSAAVNGESAETETDGVFSTLYVKNLNFSTTESDLRDHLLRVDAVHGLRMLSIPEKTNGKGAIRLSMGFGFLEYVSTYFATEALNRIHHSVLEGHKLEVKPSEKRLSVMKAIPKSSSSSSKVSNKLLVKNIAFQATQRYVYALSYLLCQSLLLL